MRARYVTVLSMGVLWVLSGVCSAGDPSQTGWWKLDEASGTAAADSSGKGNDGTLVGAATHAAGLYGGGVYCNGTEAYVQVPGILTQTGTVAFWFKPDWAGSDASDYRLFDASAGDKYFFVSKGAVHNTMTAAYFGFFFEDAADTDFQNVRITAADNITAGTWYHVAVTWEFGGGPGILYFNGQEVSRATGLGGFPALATNPRFGYTTGAGGVTATNGAKAALDDIKVFNRVLTADEIPGLMEGAAVELASGAVPADAAIDVLRDTSLAWTSGAYAASHNVYLGTSFDDVNTASVSSPKGVLMSQGQTATTFDPAGLLAFGQTYYWRVDEVNAAPDATVYKGRVWNFTAEPYGYPVKPTKATASSSLSSSTGPEKTIDGSGLDALDQHGISSSQMWVSKKVTGPIWIQYEFDKVYKLHEMWVWNSNQAVESSVGFGAKNVKIETSQDGTTWTALVETMEFAQASGEPNYVHNTTVAFGGVQAKFVRLTIADNWADGTKQASLSEVRFFYVPVKAFSPTPATGTANVALDAVLNWRPGREAAKHDVYVGVDANAVANNTAAVKTVTEHQLALATLGLEYARTYTWKVVEVNTAATPTSWEGDLWSFSTPAYGLVDDFESYNDNCNRIFFAWVDGYGHNGSADCGVAVNTGNGSGSTVGNTNPPFAERTVVHGGRQAMPLAYDNTTGKSLSEAVRTFDPVQDWTLGGVKTLVLWVRGDMANGAGQLYVKINDKQVTYSRATALTTPLWTQWNIDLSSVGTNLKAVRTLSIGVSGSGKGMVYVDDLRLYGEAPAVAVPVDPGTGALQLLYKMEGDVKDSSGKGNNGTAVGDPIYVDGPVGYGKGLQFEGTDDHVEVPVGNLISTLTSVTVATWVNLNTSNTGSWERAFDFGTSSTAGYMFLSPRQGTNGAMRFAITTGTNTGESGLNSPTTLSAGWHHVAAMIDGTTKTMQLCLDGEVVASGPTAVLPKDLGKTTQNWLGRSQWTGDAYFAGIMDEFRIYSRALTAGEIRYLAGDR